MKTGNIGIRNLADIGVADIDPYETDKRKYKAFEKTEKVKLRIGVFFDGTGNNRYNSDSVYYNTKYSNLPLKEDEIPKIKDFKSFVIESRSSYWNSYSNVALLHDLYEEKTKWEQDIKTQNLQLKFYMEGIGTLRNEEDDMIGAGLGEGKYGVISRVQQACKSIADEIAKIFLARQKITNKVPEIISIQFDVFGFSRGAAAARHFCNEVLKTGRDTNTESRSTPKNIRRPVIKKSETPKDFSAEVRQYKADGTKKVKDNTQVVPQINAPVTNVFTGGSLGAFLKQRNINYPKFNVSIEFLGIFDTVISQMLEKKGIIDEARNPVIQSLIAPFNPVIPIFSGPALGVALIKKVNPTLSNPNIKKVLHLKAQTEWRENFPVTPIGKFNGVHAKELTVLGAHSDVGGAYWQTEAELNTLHFFDLGVNASSAEKQKLEQQKKLLRNWYISQRLCSNQQIHWQLFHHVLSYEGQIGEHPSTTKKELMEETFMGNSTVKTMGNRTYVLQGYHHKLLSKRPLNNKLSLAYMNVMKYIALHYADVPFTFPIKDTPHPEEYILPEGNGEEQDLKSYQDLLIKVAGDGWTNREGKVTTYPLLVNNEGYYKLSAEMSQYILENFVHLSANFNSPLKDALDHYNLAYANVPQFTDEKEFKNPPYERKSYNPELIGYDLS
ncbi:phospholipase effector Tle1 domain-containing protein [Chryseobacterium taeanense]|uniref:phospholipase effector Tle1 domain-containing protein n=1 Tax=Chryseobacterium taeanense TaxID=311334 RepID=UPI0035B3F8F7